MKERLLWILLLATIFGLIWASSLHEALSIESSLPVSSNFERTFTFNAQQGLFKAMHTLYVSVPASLYDYYSSESHSANNDGDYVKFVTSDAFKPIAEDIQNVTGNLAHSEEQFANAVLAVVRQVTYVRSTMKYPVEAIVENSGDCDVLSTLAASIMKAGGLDVVLFYYKGLNPSHVNLGVYLPNPPVYHSIWTAPTGFEYNNKTYWMGEATSRGEWRLGDKPDLLTYATPTIIPLDIVAKPSPARVSSSLDTPLIPSNISASLFFDDSNSTGKNHLLTISGEISPSNSNKTVVMYINQDRYPFKTSTTVTDNDGMYVFTWNFTSTGIYHIRTSLGDFSDYAGSDSEKLAILISPYQPSIGVDNEAENDLGPAIASVLPFYNRATREILNGNISGTGALLRGEFMILSNNQTTTPIIRQVISPKITYVGIPRSRRVIKIITGEEAIVEQTINNQVGFILRQNGEENFSARVRIGKDNDISQIASQFDMDNAAFVNATQLLTEQNIWYKIEATISKNGTNAKLYEENGTLLEMMPEENVTISDQLGILMSYNPNAILAFRNLKVETLGQPTPPTSVIQEKANELEWLGSNIYLQTLTAVALATVSAASYVRRKIKEKMQQN
jgi:hypothetical protein